jgi:hypothetical protein
VPVPAAVFLKIIFLNIIFAALGGSHMEARVNARLS